MAANGDLEMRVERLLNPGVDVELQRTAAYFASLPGFHMDIRVTEKKDEPQFTEMQKLVAMTELLKTKYPQYDYSLDAVKARTAERKTIDNRINAEVNGHKTKMHKLLRERQFLNQLAQIDDNLLIVEAEKEETEKHLNTVAYKAKRKAKRDSVRHERNEAALAAQNARRSQEVKRFRSSAPMPELEPEDEEVQDEYDVLYGTAASA